MPYARKWCRVKIREKAMKKTFLDMKSAWKAWKWKLRILKVFYKNPCLCSKPFSLNVILVVFLDWFPWREPREVQPRGLRPVQLSCQILPSCFMQGRQPMARPKFLRKVQLHQQRQLRRLQLHQQHQLRRLQRHQQHQLRRLQRNQRLQLKRKCPWQPRQNVHPAGWLERPHLHLNLNRSLSSPKKTFWFQRASTPEISPSPCAGTTSRSWKTFCILMTPRLAASAWLCVVPPKMGTRSSRTLTTPSTCLGTKDSFWGKMQRSATRPLWTKCWLDPETKKAGYLSKKKEHTF